MSTTAAPTFTAAPDVARAAFRAHPRPGFVDASGWDRIDLLVVPPDADPEFAEAALATAGDDIDHRVAAILEHATTTTKES